MEGEREIRYSREFDETIGYILRANEDVIRYLKEGNKLIAKGSNENPTVVYTEEESYKLLGVNLPSTLLVVSDKGEICLESQSYLRFEQLESHHHNLYLSLKHQEVSHKLLFSDNIQPILDSFALSRSELREELQLSNKEFDKLQTIVTFVAIEQRFVFFSRALAATVFRKIVLNLMENNCVTKWWNGEEMGERIGLVWGAFCTASAKMLGCNTRKEEEKEEFQLNTECIMRMILIEMGEAKEQYLTTEMRGVVQEMVQNLMPVEYLTENLQTGQIEPEWTVLIEEYYLTVNKVRQYYDPLEIESSIRGRIRWLGKQKTTFTIGELKGVFSHLPFTFDFYDILLKHFRNYGILYELKLIIAN